VEQKREALWPLWLFLVISAVVSWTIWLWPFSSRGAFYFVLFGKVQYFPLVLLKLLLGNCMPGLLAIPYSFVMHKERTRRALVSLIRWRVSLKWYVFALVLPCIIFFIASDSFFFWFPRSFPPATEFLRSLLLTLPFGPLWEEIAWRSYALPILNTRYKLVTSFLLMGTYWSVWHIPLWIVTLHLNEHSLLPVLSIAILNLVAWSVIFAFLYEGSGCSLPVVILLHGAYSAASDQRVSVNTNHGLLMIAITALLSICVAVFLGRKMNARNPQNSESVASRPTLA